MLKEIFHTTVPYLGVVIGFLLATLKDFITNKFINKPKLKLELKNGSFNYFYVAKNGFGDHKKQVSIPQDANRLSFDVCVDVFNYGKKNTAVKKIGLIVQALGEKQTLTPTVSKHPEKEKIFSFNLPANNIYTLDISLLLEREDNDEELTPLFHEDIDFDLQNKNRLIFILYIEDIHGKRKKLYIEPISILKAL